jgi:hypothetical protein
MGMFTLYFIIFLKKKKKKKNTDRPVQLVLLLHDFFYLVVNQYVRAIMFHAMFHVRGTNCMGTKK